ncbi:hypothetical protein ABZX90_27415 [Streptomyces sp. NPDC002935]|uniref:hypothetical protein n=1 Tax=Streptomyces sp. NPDC002935 TaxID=3154545 RepID=UPI0033A77439
MTTGPDVSARPKDYRLLIPREWFRIDLVQERWRRQLKTFVDLQADGKNVPAEAKQEAWASLRNTAESAVANGALEFFLRPELHDGSIMPVSLIVSLIPSPGSPTPKDLLASFEEREHRSGRGTEVSIVALPAGEAVQIRTRTTLDLYIHMPGTVGYLVLGFVVPLTGVIGPMERLCTSIAGSLRWIM